MSAEKKPSGREIIDRYLETQEVESELAFIRMVTYIPGGVTKKHRFLALSKKMEDGRDAYLMRMIGPEEFKGVTVFARYQGEGEADQYIYLPEIGRVTRLGGDSKSGAFLGSDFTFEDLLHEVPANFTYTRAADALTFGAEAYVVKAKPGGDDSGSIYVRRDLYIEKGTFNLLKVDFFGPGEKLIKSLSAYGYHSANVKGDTYRPERATMFNREKGTSTVFVVMESRLDLNLEARLFTPQHIKEWTDEEVRDLIFQNDFTVVAEPEP